MWFLESQWLKGPMIVFLRAIPADVRSDRDLPNTGNTLLQKAQHLWPNAVLMVVLLPSPKTRTILVWWQKGGAGIPVTSARLAQWQLRGRQELNALAAAALYPKKFSRPPPPGEKCHELGIWADGFPLVLSATSCHTYGSSTACLWRSPNVKDRNWCRKQKSVLLERDFTWHLCIFFLHSYRI